MFKAFYWIVRVLMFPFYRARIEGKEHLPQGAAVVCSNHSTNSDAIFLVLANGPKGDYGFIAKDELFHIPVLRHVIRWLHAFPVKRGQHDVGAIKTAFSVLKKGRKLLIFPEGTRVRNGKSRRTGLPVEVKNGAVLFSHRAGVPLVPVYIPEGAKLFRNNTVRIGQPFFPSYCEQKPTADEYAAVSAELMRRIYSLKNGVLSE